MVCFVTVTNVLSLKIVVIATNVAYVMRVTDSFVMNVAYVTRETDSFVMNEAKCDKSDRFYCDECG